MLYVFWNFNGKTFVSMNNLKSVCQGQKFWRQIVLLGRFLINFISMIFFTDILSDHLLFANISTLQCLMVQGFWVKASWGFPKGKVNKDEEPINCAVREVSWMLCGMAILILKNVINFFNSCLRHKILVNSFNDLSSFEHFLAF